MIQVAIQLLNSGRGSGEVARQQGRFLVSKGHKVYFMHPRIGEGISGATNLEVGLHESVIPVHEHLPSAGPSQEPVSGMPFERAKAFLRDYEDSLESVIDNVDIVIGHHANLCAIAAANVSRRAGKPYVLFLHGTGIEPRHQGGYDDQLWSLIQDAIEGASGIIVTTEYVRDQLVCNLVDLPAERILVLPCGVDLDEFHFSRDEEVMQQYGLPETYVICPGALTTSKGPQNVVEASKEYADLAPTIFIGDGELRQQIESSLEGRGKLLGFVSAEHKAALINAATVLVAAPEKKEHFGIIYVEGLAAGTPSVAYEGGGVSSIITNETGVLTERDPKLLGGQVRRLLLDSDLLGAMTQRGRERAEDKFCYTKLGERLEEWLVMLCASDKS